MSNKSESSPSFSPAFKNLAKSKLNSNYPLTTQTLFAIITKQPKRILTEKYSSWPKRRPC